MISDALSGHPKDPTSADDVVIRRYSMNIIEEKESKVNFVKNSSW